MIPIFGSLPLEDPCTVKETVGADDTFENIFP